MSKEQTDTLASGRRFVLGVTRSNRLELDFFNLYAWLLRFADDKKILDIACGSGLGSFILAHRASEVWGIDFSKEAIDFAARRYRLDNLKFVQADFFDYDLPAEYFDVIISAMTIEQIAAEHQPDFLSRLKRTLKSDGLIVLVTPNRQVTSPYGGTGHHWNKKEFDKSELNSLLDKAELKPIGWYGRRRVFFLWANYLVRKFLGLLQKLLVRNFGFYGRRESPAVAPVNWLWQPKDFVVVTKKIIH